MRNRNRAEKQCKRKQSEETVFLRLFALLTPSSLRVCEPAGIRTQDPYIKSVMLYQLSYGFIKFG
jgi:hypothetical protein